MRCPHQSWRETHQSRGFAFINFFAREDAQKAIDKLDGHGYDHLILSDTWANPSSSAPQQAFSTATDTRGVSSAPATTPLSQPASTTAGPARKASGHTRIPYRGNRGAGGGYTTQRGQACRVTPG